MCSFAVASSGNRCLLETRSDETTTTLECKTSDVIAGDNLHEHIESDECLLACGLNRISVGISSDNLLEPRFVGKLCSPRCRRNCLNIVNLYSSLALGEGKIKPLPPRNSKNPFFPLWNLLSVMSQSIKCSNTYIIKVFKTP